MTRPRDPLATATLARDIGVAGAGTAAAALHLLGASWLLAGLAATAAAAWVFAERRSAAWADRVNQAAFIVLGLLMVWRFAERYLWLSVAGLWLLVSAADLTRLCRRFPADSGVLDQRLTVSRRLQNLALLGLASAAVVGVSLVLTLELRLVAVALLALFVVMVVVRIIRSIAGLSFSREDDEPGR